MSDSGHIVHVSEDHAAESPIPAAMGIAGRSTPRRDGLPYAHKFRAALAMLIGFAVGAIAVAIVILASGSSHGPSVPWSSWRPSDGGTLGATEIADHIAPLYRISAVDQLAVVTVVNVASPSAATAATTPTGSGGLEVAVRPDPSSSAVSLLGGNTIAYNLCGIGGSDCAIGVGTPSTQRLLLLRREALELALYTFKYIAGVDNVVAILPPGHTEQTSTLTSKPPTSGARSSNTTPVDIAVLFVREELAPWLQQPITSTLPEQFPPTVDQMAAAPEAGLVDQITARGLFSEHIEQAQDGSSLIVLDPLPPQ